MVPTDDAVMTSGKLYSRVPVGAAIGFEAAAIRLSSVADRLTAVGILHKPTFGPKTMWSRRLCLSLGASVNREELPPGPRLTANERTRPRVPAARSQRANQAARSLLPW